MRCRLKVALQPPKIQLNIYLGYLPFLLPLLSFGGPLYPTPVISPDREKIAKTLSRFLLNAWQQQLAHSMDLCSTKLHARILVMLHLAAVGMVRLAESSVPPSLEATRSHIGQTTRELPKITNRIGIPDALG